MKQSALELNKAGARDLNRPTLCEEQSLLSRFHEFGLIQAKVSLLA